MCPQNSMTVWNWSESSISGNPAKVSSVCRSFTILCRWKRTHAKRQSLTASASKIWPTSNAAITMAFRNRGLCDNESNWEFHCYIRRCTYSWPKAKVSLDRMTSNIKDETNLLGVFFWSHLFSYRVNRILYCGTAMVDIWWCWSIKILECAEVFVNNNNNGFYVKETRNYSIFYRYVFRSDNNNNNHNIQ